MNRSNSTNKDKIITVILIILGIIVLGFCINYVMNYEGKKASDITIVKDMNNEIRVIGDKTDVYNNADGTIVMKGDKPTNYMEPTDLFKEKPKVEPGNNTERHNTVYVPNPNRGELQMAEEVVVEEVVEEEYVVDTSITLEEALLVLRNNRNKGSTLISRGISIHDSNWQTVSFSTIAGDNGLILVPFNLSNTNQLDNLKKWSTVYDTYNGDIKIVFLNTSYFIADNRDTIAAEFEKRGINKDIPVYFDMENEISMLVSKIMNIEQVGYFVLNRDSFVYKIEKLGSDVSKIRDDIVELNKLMADYIVQEELITYKHGAGLIRKYEHIQMALDGTLDAYWEEYWTELGINTDLESETETGKIETE